MLCFILYGYSTYTYYKTTTDNSNVLQLVHGLTWLRA